MLAQSEMTVVFVLVEFIRPSLEASKTAADVLRMKIYGLGYKSATETSFLEIGSVERW